MPVIERAGCVTYPDERCSHCTVIGTFGLAHPGDPRLAPNQPIGRDGLIHDPAVHEHWCPVAREGDDA